MFITGEYCTKDFEVIMRKGWNGEIIHSHSESSHSKGVCILFAKDLAYTTISVQCDNDGRTLLVNIEMNGVVYSICNVHCPHDVTDRVKYLAETKCFTQKHAVAKQNIYLGGDFNCVESPLDKVSQRLDKSSTTLTQIKNELNLVDIWRVFNPHKKGYSFIDPSRQGRDSRIDLWLISKANANNVISCDINQAPAPDHKAITLCVKAYSRKRGKGYWIMNNSVISDAKYKEGIIELCNDAIAQYANVPRVYYCGNI